MKKECRNCPYCWVDMENGRPVSKAYCHYGYEDFCVKTGTNGTPVKENT